MNLESGAVDAVAMDIVVAKYQIESRSAEFKILDYEIASEQYGVGFAKGNDAVKDQVQKTLEEMAADGTLVNKQTNWKDRVVLKTGGPFFLKSDDNDSRGGIMVWQHQSCYKN